MVVTTWIRGFPVLVADAFVGARGVDAFRAHVTVMSVVGAFVDILRAVAANPCIGIPGRPECALATPAVHLSD